MHVGQRILTRIAETEDVPDEDVRIVRLAALLHDIGHGPFSHVSEYILDQFYDRTALGTAAVREKIHEKITVDIIAGRAEIAGLLTDDERDAVIRLIQGTGLRDYRRDIVSSSLDADKMDYLLRDAYFAGVRYGQFDLEKVIESCQVVRNDDETFLMVEEAGLFAVEQLVLSKNHMTQQVYAHRVRTITDTMIVRGLELAVESDPDIRRAYTYDGTPDHLDRYLALDDARLLSAVIACDDHRASSIFQRLRDRRLFKEVALVQLDDSSIPNALKLKQLVNLAPEHRRRIEEAVGEALGCEPWQVVVHRKDVKNSAYQAPGGFDPEAIYVVAWDGTPKSLGQFDALTVALRPSVQRLHVIAPWESTSTSSREQRRVARRDLSQQIVTLVLGL